MTQVKTNVLDVSWVVAEEPTRYLKGGDYPKLCGICRAAIDAMATLIHDLPDEYTTDPEGPMMAAYDNGLLCGGHDCACQREKELWSITIQVITYDRNLETISYDWRILPVVSESFDAVESLAVGMFRDLGGKENSWMRRDIRYVDVDLADGASVSLGISSVIMSEKNTLQSLERAGWAPEDVVTLAGS